MKKLSSIQQTVRQVADAITAALDLETEIVDDSLKIIGGTGRYVKKIGSYEEDGDLNSRYIYADILRKGYEYVSLDTRNDNFYDQVEGELAEITCPIKLGEDILGIIGLIAFTKEQQELIVNKRDTFLVFLRHMADLLASKLVVSQTNTELAAILESMPEGLLATDKNGLIFSCNSTCEDLLKKSKRELIDTNISSLFPNESFFLQSSRESMVQKEIQYVNKGKVTRLYFNAVPLQDMGAIFLFTDALTATKRATQITYTHNHTTFDDIINSSKSIDTIKSRAYQVASSNSTILITGESGTGKELFARSIHNASGRASEPFVGINCGAIPDALLESELFGYEKGSFTGASSSGKVGKFELADKGTIFLDEVGDMPLHLQVKLLSVLQNRTIDRVGGTHPIDIDVRVIAATNKDLEKMIQNGEFRDDLFFRLNVIPLHIPPLRERREDIEVLLMKSLHRFSTLMKKNIETFEPTALSALLAYQWPGNVRELENAIEYSVNVAEKNIITLEDIPPRIWRNNVLDEAPKGASLKAQTDLAQVKIISNCLKETGETLEGKRKAADILGISESTLYRKMRELNMNN